jgi:hypothetical protein
VGLVVAFLLGFGSAIGGVWIERVWTRHDQGLDWKGNHRGYMR